MKQVHKQLRSEWKELQGLRLSWPRMPLIHSGIFHMISKLFRFLRASTQRYAKNRKRSPVRVWLSGRGGQVLAVLPPWFKTSAWRIPKKGDGEPIVGHRVKE